MKKFMVMAFAVSFAFVLGESLSAAITPTDFWQSSPLETPYPTPFTWNSSICYYESQLIYPANDQKIYAYDLTNATSSEVLDLSSDPKFGFGPSGFLLSHNNYLYFHDNGKTRNIYRIDLTTTWPPDLESFDTAASGSIFSFAENPWTDVLWFASADFPPGDMYLFEVDRAFTRATQRASFPQPHEGGSGPIIFNGTTTLLYGESVWGGDGYFHLVDSITGDMAAEDYLVFDGGLASVAYGYNEVVYATSGGGKTIYEVQGTAKTPIATTVDDAQGLAFDGMSFYVSTQVPFSGGQDDGAINFHGLWNPDVAVQVVPTPPYRARYLGEPDPAAFAWNSALAYYDHQLIYAGHDGKIYAYHLITGDDKEVLDLSEEPDFGFGPSGFLISRDHYLYFHDNGYTDKIYRIDLTASVPSVASFPSGAQGSIFAFTQNPWTDVIWFASGDFPPGNMYLYQVNRGFTAAIERASFPQPHEGGNGPIIFSDETTLVYGESVWGGSGYLHLIDAASGEMTHLDHLVFEDGLVGAVYGYNDLVYVTTGAGKKVFQIQGPTKTELATTSHDVQGIAFDGTSLYVTTQTPTGVIGGLAIWRVISTGVPAEQEAPEGQVAGDLAVKALGVTGDKAIGVSPGDAHSFLEYLESIDPEDVEEGINRPDRFPFGLIRFRLKATSEDGTATAVVHLSDAAPKGSKWYRYDPITGWYDYSEHATFSGDRTSVALEFTDGGDGDADRMVNGYILEPGGVGLPKDTSGGGGTCFIAAAGSGGMGNGYGMPVVILVWGMLVGCSLVLMSHDHTNTP